MKGVTIHHVARVAGVSPSTVSNYLNGRSGRMLPRTRTRVADAIEQLGYRPNRAARRLRTGRMQVIGLVVPTVANPFWGGFARYLERSALANGYHVLLCNSERESARERRYLEELWADGVRGVVLGSSLPDLDHVRPLVDLGLHVIAFDRTAQAGDPATLVNISVDNVVGAHLAAAHLLDLGHRHIAFVSGGVRSVNRGERLRGFTTAYETAGLDPGLAVIWSGSSKRAHGELDAAELGHSAACELLRAAERPSAFVAINDMCALGVSAAVRDAGLRVGHDVSVVGFDDIVFAELAVPPLTTVRQPIAEMAEAAFRHLRVRIEDTGPIFSQSLLLRPELVIRSSTGPAADNGTRRRR